MVEEMRKEETIQITVLDSVIYGAARAFDYLGPERGQEMLDLIGNGIIDYCVKLNYLQPSKDPQEFLFRLVEFFKKYGYVSEVEVTPDGDAFSIKMRGWRYIGLMKKLRNQQCFLLTCPLCLARDAFEKANDQRSRYLTEELSPDGSYKIKVKQVPVGDARFNLIEPADLSGVPPRSYSTIVGLPVFETVEYGLACGFEYLGAQAQLLLDNIGRGTIEFLQDELHLELPSGYERALPKLAEFFIKEGLCDGIESDLSESQVKLRFRNYRYSPVLKRLLEEGHPLTSCPFVLAARGILRENGFVVSEMNWTLGNGRDAALAMKLRKISGQVFDEEAVASLMESV
jgi:hypothetical protein